MEYVYGVLLYCIAMFIVFGIGLSQKNWMQTNNQYVLSFRKPTSYRLGSGMMSLLFLVGAISLALSNPHGSDFFGIWCFLVPFLLFTCLFFYIAGPQDVSIDLETRICHETVGWMFHPRQRRLALTEASWVAISSGSKSYYICLMIGGGTKRWFLIARPSSQSQALSFAQEIGEKLHLPFKETTQQEMLQLS